jgi:hypothetical protein
MDIDGESTTSQDGYHHYFKKKTVMWSTDTSIATTTADLFSLNKRRPRTVSKKILDQNIKTTGQIYWDVQDQSTHQL